jgi:hypothetical protein
MRKRILLTLTIFLCSLSGIRGQTSAPVVSPTTAPVGLNSTTPALAHGLTSLIQNTEGNATERTMTRTLLIALLLQSTYVEDSSIFP